MILLAALLLTGMNSLCAQTLFHYNAALLFVQSGELDSAKKEVDLHMKEPGAQKSADSWYLQGVIYKEMYKKYENNNSLSPYRTKAFEAFKISLTLDTIPEHQRTVRDNIRYIALRYYNDAVATLDTARYATSVTCYQNYREAVLLADPGINIKEKDEGFYVALASMYYTIYNLDKKTNAKFFDLTRETYLKVLSWNPNNYTANYNLGLLFWNKGVDLMYEIDYDINLDSAMDVQDHSVELFKESLPFAEKAYEIAPKREETLVVLSGIYYSLNEFQKSKAYQQMLEDLRK
ncbi:hypothetical protein BH11BAC7_BH11BAC7_12810 [soil metagenome]